MSKILDALVSVPWLIQEEWLRTIVDIVTRERIDPDLARQLRADRASRPSALAVRAGRPLDGARTATMRDGVALIPVIGPIVRYGDFFSEVSGLTSVDTLALDVQAALDAPHVRAILLSVDSPGGEVTGIQALADVIYQARGQKPIEAFVEGLGASAAYWLSAATSQVTVDPTAIVGSIGVVMAVRNPDAMGKYVIDIVSSNAPNKRPDVRTEGGRATIQRIVDDLESVFIDAVAQYRGVTRETVLIDFGQGGVFVGQHGVTAGLADAVGSFESVLARLRDRAAGGSFMADKRGFWAWVQGEQPGAVAESAASEDRLVSLPNPPSTADDDARAALEAQLHTERAAREAAEREAASLKAAQRDAERRTLVAAWPGAVADHLVILAAIEGDADATEAYTRTLRAAAAQIDATALTQSAGTSGTGAPARASEQLLARANAYRQEHNVGLAAAIAAVSADDPALYERYVTESQIKVGKGER